jgi:hypothetical protein
MDTERSPRRHDATREGTGRKEGKEAESWVERPLDPFFFFSSFLLEPVSPRGVVASWRSLSLGAT